MSWQWFTRQKCLDLLFCVYVVTLRQKNSDHTVLLGCHYLTYFGKQKSWDWNSWLSFIDMTNYNFWSKCEKHISWCFWTCVWGKYSIDISSSSVVTFFELLLIIFRNWHKQNCQTIFNIKFYCGDTFPLEIIIISMI